MKIIREHIIFEKFTDESDPIKDMGIGNPFYRIKPGTILELTRDMLIKHQTSNYDTLLFEDPLKFSFRESNFYAPMYSVVKNVYKKSNDSLKLQLIFMSYKLNIEPIRQQVLNSKAFNFDLTYGETDYETWEKYFEIIKL